MEMEVDVPCGAPLEEASNLKKTWILAEMDNLFQSSFRKTEADRLINHVFLPRKLPQSSQPDETNEDESKLLSLMTETINDFNENVQRNMLPDNNNLIPQSTLQMFNTWSSLQGEDNLDERFVSEAIQSLKEGDMFALYIRQHNCGMILSMARELKEGDKKRLLISTFPASLPNRIVTKSPNDLAMEFPTQSVEIPKSDILNSLSFAQQLSKLHITSFEKGMAETVKAGTTLSDCRDVAKTIFVSEWLAATLADKDSKMCAEEEFPRIVKKLRDEVLLKKDKGTLYPFRRSGFWMTLKVALQLNLVHELGHQDGLFLYKLILAQLMSTQCKFLLSGNYGELNIDLAMQMLKKVARRLEKMKMYAEDITNSSLSHIFKIVFDKTNETIQEVRKKADNQFGLILEIDNRSAKIEKLEDLDFANDIYHKIPKVKSHILARTNGSQSTGSISYVFRSESIQRCYNDNFPPLHILSEADEVRLGIALADVENWIFEHLSDLTNSSVTTIRDLVFKYAEKAVPYYKDDPLGYSRMVLAFLNVVRYFDKTAVEIHPLLKEHRSGVNIKIVDQLLLPKRKDLELASSLEEYFKSRNAEKYPSLIEEEHASENSFSARYGSSNDEMCKRRDDILAKAEEKIRAKRAEVQTLRERVKSLQEQLVGLDCQYGTRTSWKGNVIKFHLKHCHKCSLERQIEAAEVYVYERPLNEELFKQNAVMFELRIPIALACLRDVLYTFSTEICQSSPTNIYSCEEWRESEQLRDYYQGHQQRTFLGGSKTSFTASHWGKLHVRSSDGSIIRINACECKFYGKFKNGKTRLQMNADIKKHCTLQVESGSPYESLQWAVESTSHSQNRILASQNACPKSLSLAEWVEFGSLRAGHRLQMRNIYRAIENEKLSFKNESVLTLIIQSLWEGGRNTSTSEFWERDAHKDIKDPKFCKQLHGILSIFLQTQRNNWKQPYNLLTVIMIVIRVLEINSDDTIEDLFSSLLIECRQIAVEWMSSIEDVMKESSSNYELIEKLRNNLVNVGISCALTYDVDPKRSYFSKILKSTDVKTWILALVKIDNNVILSEASGETKKAKNVGKSIDNDGDHNWDTYLFTRSIGTPMKESLFRRNLLRMIRNTGVKIEFKLKAIIREEKFKDLNTFAAEYFTADHNENDHWHEDGTVFYKMVKDKNEQFERCIQLDLIRGRFLVDNLPVARLPEEIVSNNVFKRVFGNTVIEVQPFGSDSFRSINKYRDCKYLFRLLRKDTIIITEERLDGHSYELVPHNYFEGEVSYLLVENYCHWWCKEKKVIEFKTLPFNLSESASSCDHPYALNLETFQLIETETRRSLIDIQSRTFKEIARVLSRFELDKYIKALTANGKEMVELSRMQLKFNVVQENNDPKIFHLDSHEYEGLRVALQHKIDGVFIGLRNGLVLQDISGTQKLLFTPHGEIIPNGFENAKFSIALDNLRQPNFFIYEVDEKFRQLKAGKSYPAWFYLAYLHAVTGQPLEDPFTGLTGTERALDILQSPHCWSCEPFDAESLKTMECISGLTPTREYYSAGHITSLQTASWPTFLSATAAHEMYSMIVQKLISDSKRLECLFTPFQEAKPITIEKTGKSPSRLQILRERMKNMFRSNPDEAVRKVKTPSEPALNMKAYYRHVCYSPNNMVSKDYHQSTGKYEMETANNAHYVSSSSHLSKFRKLPKYDPQYIHQHPIIKSLRKLSALEHDHALNIPPRTENVILDFLINNTSTLSGVTEKEFWSQDVDSWMQFILKDRFLDLYTVALQVNTEERKSEWSLFLCCLAFNEQNFNILSVLQAVSRNPETFENLVPPKFSSYQDPSQNFFDKDLVKMILRSCSVTPEEYLTRNDFPSPPIVGGYSTEKYAAYQVEFTEYKAKKEVLLQKYNMELKEEVDDISTKILESCWPADNCNELKVSPNLVKVNDAIPKINLLLQKWNQNRQLLEFLKTISNVCGNLSKNNCSITLNPWTPTTNSPCQKKIFQINFDEMMCKSFIDDSFDFSEDAKNIFDKGTLPCKFEFPAEVGPNDVTLEILENRKTYFQQISTKYWRQLESLTTPPEVSHLVASGLYPRIIPTRMLSKLIAEGSNTCDVALRNLIGACGVCWTHEQQAVRMIKFAKKSKSYENSLRRELETIAEEKNWTPKKNPEWLLFELEMNLKIRSIQVEVAERMICPPGGSHSVMQLNMGEGKTAVIVPLLCLALGDGKSLCRVTVLKSLFQTNLASLRYCLGGILNRRLYTFPCRRDMAIEEDEAREIQYVYQECLSRRGIVVTLPEYILSFQLKMYEVSQRDESTAKSFMDIYKWLNSNTRDILDESDEILHAKYQLIYTVGEKVRPAGESLRWTISQSLLKLVPSKLKILLESYGVENVEFDNNFANSNGKEVFTPCRLLQEKFYDKLIDLLVEDFLDGKTSIEFPELTSSGRQCIKEFLTEKKIDEERYEKVMRLLDDNVIQKNTILILAGYLKYEVLRVALFKRWRVNYGVNPKGKRLRMAVPFKAKDVAAEMTEFGHPDIAICLTQLSYYYSGLDDAQLLECFDILEQMPDGGKVYESWINQIEPEKVHPTIQNYEGLPLDDAKKREEYLFPILRKNMYVIDFWLAKSVFPTEARQFEEKMMATPWDICCEDKSKTLTGFSGTNDSKYLLPGPVQQNDLEKLKATNDDVKKTLLREENEGYHALAPNVTGTSILEQLITKGIPVLIDSGALMLELSNEEVAQKWLQEIHKMRKKNPMDNENQNSLEKNLSGIEAAVYFNNNDILMVKDQNNREMELELSSYRDRLECCVVYLDDCHTRGTDLKFPVNTKACVTLGGSITRDKTVQACMRMRMLGNGHSISFWASQEAHNSIQEHFGQSLEQIKTKHVIDWIENNSQNFVKDSLVHWAAAGVNYAQKRALHNMMSNRLRSLGKLCCDKELLDLMDMYGRVKKEEFFTRIIEMRFDILEHDIKGCEKRMDVTNALRITARTRNDILSRLKEHIGNVKRFAELLEEEQEKELQEEKERNVEMSVMPEKRNPYTPKLDKNMTKFLSGDNDSEEEFWKTSVFELPHVLRKYKLDLENIAWGHRVFASRDFIFVVESNERGSSYFGDRSSLFYRYSLMSLSSRAKEIPGKNVDLKDVGFNINFLRPVVWIASVVVEEKIILLLLSPYEANAYLPIFQDIQDKKSHRKALTLHMYSPRLKKQQNSLINNTDLQVIVGEPISIDGHILAQLSVFSGSLYFENKEEEEEYCHFVGIVPRSRSEKRKNDFEKGLITKSGFVPPNSRALVSSEIQEKCKFNKCPDKLIREIAEGRHGFFPRSSHVSKLVTECKGMFYEENE